MSITESCRPIRNRPSLFAILGSPNHKPLIPKYGLLRHVPASKRRQFTQRQRSHTLVRSPGTTEGSRSPRGAQTIAPPQSLRPLSRSVALGKGGFGTVYRAIDEQLQREVAVKVTLGESLEPEMRQSFLIEARIVAKLDHPHIVPVLDVGPTDQGDFYVVSKLIEGSNLADRIDVDRPTRNLSLRIVEQIADALHYAHSQGLIHRDVKPANILLDRNDRPYLTDFGIALRKTNKDMHCAFAMQAFASERLHCCESKQGHALRFCYAGICE